MISIFYTTELETPGLKLQAAPGFPEFVCRECRAAGRGSALPWILPGNEPQLPPLISHLRGSRAVFMPHSQSNVPNSHPSLRLKLLFFPRFLPAWTVSHLVSSIPATNVQITEFISPPAPHIFKRNITPLVVFPQI